MEMVNQYEYTNQLDQEWVELILVAKKIGLTPEEIREFLQIKKNTQVNISANSR